MPLKNPVNLLLFSIACALSIANLSACKSTLLGEAAIVVPENAEIRSSTAKASRSVGALKRGDQVTIVEKTEESGDQYVKVKGPGDIEGWLPARNLVTRRNAEKSKSIFETIAGIPTQAECKNRASVKLRVTPDKSSDENVIVQLPAQMTFELVSRETRPKAAATPAATKNSAKPESDEKEGTNSAGYEVWYKVRVKDNPTVPAGYVYSGSVDMDIPHDIAYFYQGGKKIVGWQRVGSIKDEKGQDNYHYAILEKSLSVPDEKSDFDYLHIVGFDPKNKSVSYYNVLRDNIRGVFPVKVKVDDRQAILEFNSLDSANKEIPVQFLVEQLDKGHVRAKRIGEASAAKK